MPPTALSLTRYAPTPSALSLTRYAPIPTGLSHSQKKLALFLCIDAWDAVFRYCPNDESLQNDWIHLLRDLFKQEDRDDVVALSYLTGILPIKKYKTQSSLNQFREYTMLCPLVLEPYVGFIPSEVMESSASASRMSFERFHHLTVIVPFFFRNF